jgi:hypothetical protein
VEPELMSDGADRRPCTGWCVDHSLRRRYLRRNQEPTARVDPTLSVTSYRSSRTGEADDFRAKAGIGFGSALAIAISWSANKSILWAIVHGILSWIYVVYYAIRYQ